MQAAAMVCMKPNQRAWARGVALASPFRQKRITQLMQLESVKRFKATFSAPAATSFLSAGGPGAGGFLWPPNGPDMAMDGVSLRIADCRRADASMKITTSRVAAYFLAPSSARTAASIFVAAATA